MVPAADRDVRVEDDPCHGLGQVLVPKLLEVSQELVQLLVRLEDSRCREPSRPRAWDAAPRVAGEVRHPLSGADGVMG